jgi:hypothetical protein
MSQADVASAEEKVKSLLGQGTDAPTADTPVASPSSDTKSDSIFGDNKDNPADSPLELHEEDPANGASDVKEGAAGPGPSSTLGSSASDDHPVSTLAPEEEAPDNKAAAPTATEPTDTSGDNIPVSGSGEVALQDVDREVNDLITKLEGEAEKLDKDMSDKKTQIDQLQAEIDNATAKKTELDKKIQSLHQVVESK